MSQVSVKIIKILLSPPPVVSPPVVSFRPVVTSLWAHLDETIARRRVFLNFQRVSNFMRIHNQEKILLLTKIINIKHEVHLLAFIIRINPNNTTVSLLLERKSF